MLTSLREQQRFMLLVTPAMNWVRMLRNKSILIACHVPTADNLADIFTKILGPEIFQRVRDRIMHRRILLV